MRVGSQGALVGGTLTGPVPPDSGGREPGGGSGKRRAILRGAVLLACGAGLLWLLLSRSGMENVAGTLGSADRGLLLAALCVFLGQGLFIGLRWWAGLRLCGYPGRLVPILRGAAAVHLVNFLAPGHFGEPVGAAWLASRGRAPGVESFAILLATKAVASLLSVFVLLAALVPLSRSGRPSAIEQAAIVAAIAFAGVAVGLAAILHGGTAERGTRLLVRAARRLAGLADRPGRPGMPGSERAAEVTERFLVRFRASFVLLARHPAALAATSAISFVKVCCLVLTVSLVYAALGRPLAPAEAAFVVSVDVLGSFAAVWIPANLGLQEAVHASAAVGGLGVEPAVAVSASLALKGLLIGHAAMGGLIWAGLGPWDRERKPLPDEPASSGRIGP